MLDAIIGNTKHSFAQNSVHTQSSNIWLRAPAKAQVVAQYLLGSDHLFIAVARTLEEVFTHFKNHCKYIFGSVRSSWSGVTMQCESVGLPQTSSENKSTRLVGLDLNKTKYFRLRLYYIVSKKAYRDLRQT